MHMNPQAQPAWERLVNALEQTQPDCLDDDRYVADLLENGEKKLLARICSACPLLEHCLDYALLDKPKGGQWPGVQLTIQAKKAA